MTRPTIPYRPAYRIRRALPAVALTVLAVAGCGKAGDHRMSLRDFLHTQRRLASEEGYAPQWKQVTDATNIDRRLTDYRLGADDVIRVTLTTEDQQDAVPPVQARLDNLGRVDLVMVGKIKLAGMSVTQAEEAIHKAYTPTYFQKIAVHVDLVDVKPTNVIVLGAVTMPGMVSLRRTERDLLHAVVAAGGMSDLSSGEVTLQRIRHPDHHVTINLTDPNGIKAMVSLPPLEEGDLITVHAATPNTYFIGGLVNIAAPQVYAPGVKINILQALAGAAGLRTDVTPGEATLIRRMPNGTDAHVKLDLARLYRGQDPNIDLKPGDILWVPDTTLTRVQDFINRTVYFRAGVSYRLIGTQDLFTGNKQKIGEAGTTFLTP